MGEDASDTEDLEQLCSQLSQLVVSKNRTYRFQTFTDCFLGSDAVTKIIELYKSDDVDITREQAVLFGKRLMKQGLIKHVTNDEQFEDKEYFYRFASLDRHRGSAKEGVQWQAGDPNPLPKLQDGDVHRPVDLYVSPMDKYNAELLNLVKPKEWIDPKVPHAKYNMVVIGAGAGGLISAIQVAGFQGKVALIEKHLLGGDCLNVGCVPSKALIRCARAVTEIKMCQEFGIKIDGTVKVDFAKIMERMRRLRAEIAPVDSAKRYASEGVDVFQGHARFTSKNTVEVNGKSLKFSKAIIATGARAFIPPIKGINEVPFLTNASLFNLTELPGVFAILGAGPIGVEMAQAFARFGSKVILFDKAAKILPREDEDAAAIVRAALEEDGVEFCLEAEVVQTAKEVIDGKIKIRLEYVIPQSEPKSIIVDQFLISAGRAPNVEDLGLEAAGVKYDRKGLIVKDNLQTTNPNIFGVGDVCLPYQFTHASDFSSRIAVRNALFPLQNNAFSSYIMPWCTYTSPEIAHVGKYEKQLREENIDYEVFSFPFAENDRAILEGSKEGFVKVICKKGKGTILGATIVGEIAGDMISELTVGICENIPFGSYSKVIHPYPTTADAIRRTADKLNKGRLTAGTKRLLRVLATLKV